MSDQTKEAFERALAAHFADEFDGAVISQWYLQGFGQRIDSESGYYLGAWPNGQPIHVTGGLIDYALNRHSTRLLSTISDEDPDDD